MERAIWIGYIWISLGLISCGKAKEEVQKKPNLLIVLSDQHSYDMLGAYGNSQVKTPNLDQFAREGLLFENCFSNQSACTPFRGMLFSGMHPLKNGAFVNDAPLLPNQSKLLGEILQKQGYQTAYIGKWHLLGGDRDRPIPQGEMRYGFDRLLTNNCHVDFRPGKAFYWNDEGEKDFFDEWEVYGQTDQAIAYLDQIDKDKPFALIVSWHPPHDWGKFKGEDGKMHYRYDTMDELMELYERDSIRLRPGLAASADRMRMYHGYMSMVSGVDKAFGLLMDKLEEIGEEDNTLTLFSADHGDMLESHNALLPKQYPHDYSSHIPFIMKYPKKLKEGSRTSLLFGALDIMPTLLGLLELEDEQDYDGRDLSDAILQGDNEAVNSVPIWVLKQGKGNNNSWRGVITKDFTFSMSKDSLELSNVLFDRQEDPYQLNNLFYHPDYHDTKAALRTLTYSWMEQFGDAFYGPEDFAKVMPEETWQYNYTSRPYDLLHELNTVK
ncbi:sulfatase [Echinicola pacifica]|uniref:Sulfatase n=1 Tax=Echinicola pacifica TaxID=346377 RepID=A0A918PNI6_9BACT|nr:sulfatase [Echinicola pacifica]GGZ16564.1 sulfatase [Echinicola pacifica]